MIADGTRTIEFQTQDDGINVSIIVSYEKCASFPGLQDMATELAELTRIFASMFATDIRGTVVTAINSTTRMVTLSFKLQRKNRETVIKEMASLTQVAGEYEFTIKLSSSK